MHGSGRRKSLISASAAATAVRSSIAETVVPKGVPYAQKESPQSETEPGSCASLHLCTVSMSSRS